MTTKTIDDTQLEAWSVIQPVLPNLTQRVVSYVREQGAHGATAAEMVEALGGNYTSLAPRFTEAKQKGLLEYAGFKRLNASGRRARVYIAA